jgi:hypothetical protein
VSFFGWKRSKTAEVGGYPGLEIDDSPLKNSPCSILKILGRFIALAPMRLSHTCKVATNTAKPSMVGCVGCSRGSPRRRCSSVFCVSRSQRRTFWIYCCFGNFFKKKICFKSTAGLFFEKSRVLLPTLEYARTMRRVRDFVQSTRKISRYIYEIVIKYNYI